ncbi:hypothetical protein [Leifsonia xyli]|uniref:hypothetical protein n=1 Tax=Leifsonia xyli TaxID=1575 RepID=UPI003D66BC34
MEPTSGAFATSVAVSALCTPVSNVARSTTMSAPTMRPSSRPDRTLSRVFGDDANWGVAACSITRTDTVALPCAVLGAICSTVLDRLAATALAMSAAFCGSVSVTASSRMTVFCGVLTEMASASWLGVTERSSWSTTGFRTTGDSASCANESIWFCV